MTSPHRHRRSKLRSIYVWHRYVGLLAAPWVVVLAVTGILLNHTAGLRLDQRYVASPPLLHWYGIAGTQPTTGFRVGDQWLTQIEDRLYLDGRALPGQWPPLIGALRQPDYLALATSQHLTLISPTGETIERLGRAAGIPADLQALGQSADGHLALATAAGRFVADPELLHWTRRPDSRIHWTLPTADLPATLLDRVHDAHRGHILSTERVILDLHSGRLFGRWGPYVMDAAAMLMLMLGFSGAWIWLQQQYKRAQHRVARRKRQQPIQTTSGNSERGGVNARRDPVRHG